MNRNQRFENVAGVREDLARIRKVRGRSLVAPMSPASSIFKHAPYQIRATSK